MRVLSEGNQVETLASAYSGHPCNPCLQRDNHQQDQAASLMLSVSCNNQLQLTFKDESNSYASDISLANDASFWLPFGINLWPGKLRMGPTFEANQGAPEQLLEIKQIRVTDGRC